LLEFLIQLYNIGIPGLQDLQKHDGSTGPNRPHVNDN
jgi:hypothetical protein